MYIEVRIIIEDEIVKSLIDNEWDQNKFEQISEAINANVKIGVQRACLKAFLDKCKANGLTIPQEKDL